MCSKVVLAGLASGLGLLFIALGAGLGWGVFPPLIEKAIGEGVALVNGSDAWELWVDIPIPLLFKVYFFNVTNPEEIMRGAKPVVQEVGPYIYLEFKNKKNIAFHPLNSDWVSYEQITSLVFNDSITGPELSDSDVLTVLNPALMGITLDTDQVGGPLGIVNGVIPKAFQDLTPQGTVFTQHTVKELLFDGIKIKCTDIPRLDVLWQGFCNTLNASEVDVETIRPENEDPNAKETDYLYSYFYHKTAHPDGRYTINTGVNNPRMLGWIHEWEGSPTLSTWQDANSVCNQINGTDAAIFPPFLDRDMKVYIFSTDLCRSLYAVYEKDIQYEGIAGLRYVASEDMFRPVETNPEHYCFCSDLESNAGCPKKGALDLQPCVHGSVMLTFPHFFQAPEYLAMVEGLNPEAEKHQTFLELEPNTGVPLRGGKRVQFNMMIKKVSGIDVTKGLPNALFPLLWIDEGVSLDEENVALLRSELASLKILTGIKWGLIGLGVVSVFVGAAVFFATWVRN